MKYLVSITFLALLLSGCYYDKEEYLYPDQAGCDTVSVTYAANILPILNGKCIACHGSGSPSSGIDLSTREKLVPYANNGHLMGTITWATNFSKMPQGGAKLTNCEINKFSRWIHLGMPQ